MGVVFIEFHKMNGPRPTPQQKTLHRVGDGCFHPGALYFGSGVDVFPGLFMFVPLWKFLTTPDLGSDEMELLF